MNISEIKNNLEKYGIDAYIIYDFRGSNFVGRNILEFNTLTTRKFVSILAKDGIHHIVSKMEASSYSGLPGKKHLYTTYLEFENLLEKLITDYNIIALDISNENSLPITDLAPSGFVDLVKKVNPKATFVPSENLTQTLAACWGSQGYKSHKKASKKLENIFEQTFDYIRSNLNNKSGLTDYEVMLYCLGLQKKEGLHSDGEDVCIVASGKDTGNPHYWPKKENPNKILRNSPLLVDMWARITNENSIYSDFTLYGWVGPDKPSKKVVSVWNDWKKARDLGVELIQKKVKTGLSGFEVDAGIRKYIEERGLAKFLLHRSGHSLGQKEHGNGANLDDFETHDTRLILADTGMTIEPGIYFKEYGVRGEIDLYIHPDFKVEVTTPLQENIILI